MLRSRAGEIGTRRCSTPANNCDLFCYCLSILLSLQAEAARVAAEAARLETLGAQAEEVRPSACRCNSKGKCVTTCKQAAKKAIAPAEAQLAAAKAEMDAAIARFKALEQVLRFKKQLKVLL